MILVSVETKIIHPLPKQKNEKNTTPNMKLEIWWGGDLSLLTLSEAMLFPQKSLQRRKADGDRRS